MTTESEKRCVQVHWWKFSWPDALGPQWDAAVEAKRTIHDVFSEILTPKEIAAFIASQDHPEFTEEQFALMCDSILRDVANRDLSSEEWKDIFDASSDLVATVVRRNYRERQQRPNYTISDGGIRLKELRCYEAFFRSMARANADKATRTAAETKLNYQDDDFTGIWSSIEDSIQRCSNPKKTGEQDGGGQPATRPESK